MTPAEFNFTLAVLGWSKRHLAEMLGCDHNLPARWEAGTAKIPPSIKQWLVRLARAHVTNPPPTDWRTK